MHVLIIDFDTSHKPLLAKLVAQKLPKVTHISFVNAHQLRSDDTTRADLVILSGGIWLVQKNPGLHQRINDLLVKSAKPVIGICLGAESLAQYFGMELALLDVRVSGATDIQLTGELAKFLHQDELRVFEHHRYAVLEASSQVEVLAMSASGIEVFRHTSLPMVAVQFHPEVRRQYSEGHKVLDYILDSFNML